MQMSPAALLQLLEQKLAAQQRAIRIYERYFHNQQRREIGTAKWEEAFGARFGPLNSNWMKIVIEAAVDRLVVTGFRFGEERDDQDAWKELWQPNNLDLESRVLHRTAGVCGVAFTLTDPINPYGDYPRITVEHPSEAAVICAPGTRHVRIAGIKKWWDENDGYTYANVFTCPTPSSSGSRRSRRSAPPGDRVDWGTVAIEHNSLGRVPLVPFFNKPGANYGGESDLVDAIPIQDAINHIVRNVVLGVEFQGFPMRAIMGWEPPSTRRRRSRSPAPT
jgi:hypothetical protein